MHLVRLHTIHCSISTAATPSHKFHHISRCLSDVTKLTWMLFGQKSTRAVLRKLWGCWFISGSMQSVLFGFLSTSPSPPSLSLHPPTPLSFHTQRRRQKSLWVWPVPSVNDILFTNTLEQCRRGHGHSHPHTPVCLSLISYPSIQMTFDLMKRSTWLPLEKQKWALEKGCCSLGNNLLQQLEPEAACKNTM